MGSGSVAESFFFSIFFSLFSFSLFGGRLYQDYAPAGCRLVVDRVSEYCVLLYGEVSEGFEEVLE